MSRFLGTLGLQAGVDVRLRRIRELTSARRGMLFEQLERAKHSVKQEAGRSKAPTRSRAMAIKAEVDIGINRIDHAGSRLLIIANRLFRR